VPELPPTAQPDLEKRVPWWLWPQVLCLDAPLVAVLWGAALGRSHYLHLPSAFLWALGLATWLIYLVDRVADDEPGPLPTSTRHWFVQRYRRWVWCAVVAGGVGLVWLVLARLPVALVGQGMVIAMLAALYLAVFAARRKAGLYRLLVLLAMAVALLFVSRMPGASDLAQWWRLGIAGVVIFIFMRLLTRRDREPGPLKAFKEPLAALLFTLGCSASVHFWTPPEHGILCDETWLLWGLFALNLWGIAAAERFHAAPGRALPIDHTVLAIALVIAGEWLKGSSLSTWVVIQCVQLSALMIGVLPLLLRRISLPLHHVLADMALVLPLVLLFWLP